MYKVISALCMFYVLQTAVCAEVITMGVGGAYASFVEDTVVAENVIVNPDKLYITNTSAIENYGVLDVNLLEVCPRCDVHFENYNTINIDNVLLNTDARIFQFVSNVDNAKPININADYTILVTGDNNLSLSDVVDVASENGRLVLENTTLHINSVPRNMDRYVQFGKNVKLVIYDIDDLYNVVLLNNVRGGSDVKFISDEDDAMYMTVGNIVDGNLIIQHVRETNYSQIFNNDTGKFIDSLRSDNNNHNLMYALDSAADMNSLNAVMSESVLFNPDVLLQPLQVLNSMNMQLPTDAKNNEFGGRVFGVLGDDFYLYGTDIELIGMFKKNFNLTIDAHISNMEYQSDLDIFSGTVYGLNISAGYLFDNNILAHVSSGVSVAEIDIPAVLYNGKIQSSPHVLFGYLVSDIGYKINYDLFSVMPVAGVAMQIYDLSGIKYSEYMGRIGVQSEYKYRMSDLEYLYGLSVVADTSNTVLVSGKIGFMSYADNVGGNLGLSVMYINDSIAYKASVNARLLF